MQRYLGNTLDFLIVGRYACKWRLRSTLDSLSMNANELRNTLDFSTVWMTNDMDAKKYSRLLRDEWIKKYSWSLNHHMIEWNANELRNALDFLMICRLRSTLDFLNMKGMS